MLTFEDKDNNILIDLTTKEVLYKIALKFNIENPENIRTLLCRWMGYDDYKKILDIRK